nr:uncharacterized protein LOC122321401 [Drosophila bipectinata]
MDLKHAFWQIELDDASKRYMAFTVPGRLLYHFVVMPFWLTNAAQRLCWLTDKVIRQELRESVFVYLDDLLVVSENFQDHTMTLEEVSRSLKAAGLIIGLKKSHFCFKELRYLGYVIDGGVVRTDPEKVEAINRVAVPKSAKEFRRFLGMAGWYRRLIRNFAELATPPTDTLRKSKFAMTEEAERSVKEALTTAPVLRHPDFKSIFYVQCDASDTGNLAGRLARWSFKLQPYQMAIEHCKGTENVMVDTLSRMLEAVEKPEEDWMLGLQTTEFESPQYVELRQVLETEKETFPDIKAVDGYVFKRTECRTAAELEENIWKFWVPASESFFLGMVAQVRAFVRDCQTCKETKPTNSGPRLGIGTYRPFQKLYIDFLGKYPRSGKGHAYIFVVVDHFSKYVFLKAMKEATTAEVVKFLVGEIFHTFGVPETSIRTMGSNSW